MLCRRDAAGDEGKDIFANGEAMRNDDDGGRLKIIFLIGKEGNHQQNGVAFMNQIRCESVEQLYFIFVEIWLLLEIFNQRL